jgi:hypothetical protein
MKATKTVIANGLIGLVVLMTVGLAYSVYAASYVYPEPETLSEQPPPEDSSIFREPIIKPGLGIQNDAGTETGPWWINESLATVIVENSSIVDIQVAFKLAVNMGVCNTPRRIVVTLNNQSTSFSLDARKNSVVTQKEMMISASNSSTIVIQVSGPACQAPNDPRLFFGQVNILDFSFT